MGKLNVAKREGRSRGAEGTERSRAHASRPHRYVPFDATREGAEALKQLNSL